MFTVTPVEIVGYVASALVVVSLAMTSVVKLRTISLVGSATFLVYVAPGSEAVTGVGEGE